VSSARSVAVARVPFGNAVRLICSVGSSAFLVRAKKSLRAPKETRRFNPTSCQVYRSRSQLQPHHFHTFMLIFFFEKFAMLSSSAQLDTYGII
jgi:hypothetical protein